MEDATYVKKLIDHAAGFEIDRIRDADINRFYSPFEGSPKKHPTDEKILVLIAEPFSRRSRFYEFSIESIGAIEEIGTITSEKGDSAYMIRVWIKKGLTALKTEPFVVE
ncbi:MAG TPA: hypothetical protein PK573_09795 [Spirochaetota bacterium]|nr:hypothetical protein [Spirochaetota bacterium]HRZ25622.1 hypothetical protein [Spirochaetota bacterium]